MQPILTVIFSFFLLLPFSVSGEMIYKCKNPQGGMLYQGKPCTEESKSVASWGSAAGAPLVLTQGSHGHYFVDGSVNGHNLSFVIDTGATVVTIPQGLANSAGLICHSQSMAQTANGITRTCQTIIQKLKFGTFTLTNVAATIAPNLEQPLLGMNVLKQFRVEQDSGEMRLISR